MELTMADSLSAIFLYKQGFTRTLYAQPTGQPPSNIAVDALSGLGSPPYGCSAISMSSINCLRGWGRVIREGAEPTAIARKLSAFEAGSYL